VPSPALSAVEAANAVASGHAVIIDVREDSEWQEQHIPEAIHIPLGQLNARLTELKPYQSTKIITQCRSGRRSAQAQAALIAAGFSNVYNLEGGIIAWQQHGLKTER
jgi:rhodanese-related sulfurtransferase